MSESWSWIDLATDDDPDNATHKLIEGESAIYGRVILECNNIDSEDQDLISAAPDLITACEAMLEEIDIWEQESGIHPAANMARAALAKARGEWRDHEVGHG
jgi:hypothetical protein